MVHPHISKCFKYKKTLLAIGFLVPATTFIVTNTLCGCGDKREVQVRIFSELLDQYYQKNGKFPGTLLEINENMNLDVWDREVKYILEPNLAIVVSMGEDGLFGTEDDVTVTKTYNLPMKKQD